jgi:hypothetical protein
MFSFYGSAGMRNMRSCCNGDVGVKVAVIDSLPLCEMM